MPEPAFDLVIRNARIATAADTFHADIGIKAGVIVQLGLNIAAGVSEIDAAGRTVTPGGVDGHCHLDQPMPPPAKMADNFDTGTRSAACGGTTTVIPFAAQAKGQSLQAAVDDYHRRADGRAHVDYAFHLIVSDPTPDVLTRELPELIAKGHTSFKIYMTYDDLKLDDGEVLDVLDVARSHGALVMVHAENADCIDWLTKRLQATGKTAPRFHGHARPMLVEREATHRAIALAELLRSQLISRGWRVVNRSALAVLCIEPPPGSSDVRAIVSRTLASGRCWVSSAMFEGREVIRACVTHGETTADDIEACVSALTGACRER